MTNIDDTKLSKTNKSTIDVYFESDPFEKLDNIKDAVDFVDFDSMPIKNISWNEDHTNLAGLYVNQLTMKGQGFKKNFVCELDIIFSDKSRKFVKLRKPDIEKLIKALIDINNNMR